MFIGLLQDLRHSSRALAKSPGFVATALLSLALGIGVNTAIFSVLHTAMERPVSALDPHELVDLSLRTQTGNMLFTLPEYDELRRRSQSFSGLMAFMQGRYRMSSPAGPEFVNGAVTSDNFFAVFRQPLLMGRGFSAERRGVPEAVISERLWRSRFAADAGVLGRSVPLYEGANRHDYMIVGVLPSDFRYAHLWSPDVVLQFPTDRELGNGRFRPLTIMGRLRPGVSMAQAESETKALAAQLAPVFPESFGQAKLNFWPKVRRDPASRAAGALVQAIVGVILLIACVNVMNLLLARRQQQRGEIAARLALGASAGRLTRQLLTETLLLSLPAALVGFGLAVAIISTVESIRLPGMEMFRLYFYLDRAVVAHAFCAAIAASLIAGLWPARAACKVDLVAALKGAGTFGGRKYGLRGALVAAQLALSLAGITVAAMLVRGVWRITPHDPGVDPQKVMTATVWPAMNGHVGERGLEFRRTLEARLRAIPGAVDVAAAAFVPGGDTRVQQVKHTGSPLLPVREAVNVRSNSVGPGFFRLFGIALVRGREPGEFELDKPVCVVNETMARRFWPNQEPLGQTVRVGGVKGRDAVVIGVSRDSGYDRLGDDPEPFLYLPRPPNDMLTLFVRTGADAGALADPVRRAIAASDPEMPIQAIGVLEEKMTGGGLGGELRLRAMIVATLGGTALLLSALGLYGVASYLASRRTREIGIRLALGATRGDVLRAVLGDSLRLAAVGMTAGVALSLVVCKLMAKGLYGVKPTEPAALGASCAILFVVYVLAVAGPAWRASRLEASAALRHE